MRKRAMEPIEPTFDRDTLPSDPGDWPAYLRVGPVSLLRMEGPFSVERPEGRLRCEAGYLGVDSAGHPYALSAGEVEASYTPAPEPAAAQETVELYHPGLDVSINVPNGSAWVYRQSGWENVAPMPPASLAAPEQVTEETEEPPPDQAGPGD